ncbi:hypothetical protein [Desulforhopalus singaporensis]|uniref:Uncharacterized protein n=1 Tax=Desulforhopalus singaporensis TaxID=91360 RepID=A0A1H0VI41_9BACT|nr:hypothetical protein [Desulforhopalus singaporensis]SDP78033.1 hypothetical protein SAMN05660330_04080 [Desulforhopalus singaporensis]
MARRESTEQNLLVLQDNLSDSTLGVFYRTPTTKERQQYLNKRTVREGKKFKDNSIANRVLFGKKIMTGLRDGDFERTVGDGEYQPISTDKNSPDYYEDWKDWMEEHCSDVLMILGYRVFEASCYPGRSEEDLEEDKEEDLEK